MKLNIIPVKFNKKISVADIKQYLVDEFDNNKKLQNQVYDLQDKLKVSKEFEVKYELSLTTLDKYKERLKQTKDRNKHLEEQIQIFQDTIKQKTYEINDLKLQNEKMEKHIKNIEKDIRKEMIIEFVLEDKNQITAYWKDTKKRFAQFYINQIIKILEYKQTQKINEFEIEKIGSNANNTLFVLECYTGIPEQAQDWNFKVLENKINELADAVNELKKEE